MTKGIARPIDNWQNILNLYYKIPAGELSQTKQNGNPLFHSLSDYK